MPTHPLDGSLPSWQDVADQAEWQVLLVGNGLSINVWSRFEYGRIFEHARDGGLTDEDLALFDGMPNFERVLADIGTAIRVSQVIGEDPAPYYERYRRLQLALGHAIRQVHLTRSMVSDAALVAIRNELKNYEWVFTTSYDLIIYWAMGCGPRGTYQPFMDLFRGTSLQFNPRQADVPALAIPVYFLHGALHLIVTGTGRTRKLRRTLMHTLLEQFGQPIPDDPQARPLLVTEGSDRDKLRSIESNDYLSHALDRLSSLELPLVVFGSSLAAQDQHLVDALSEHPDRPVAVSLRPAGKRELIARQVDIYNRLPVETLLFFDSTTHPLGAPELRVG